MSNAAKALVAATVLAWCGAVHADTQVYLLRGWFGVFSTGMDALAETLQGQGIKAEAIGHLAWRSAAAKIIADRAEGKTGRVVLVGHSQGGNNTIDIARELERHAISVDLLITLAPFRQDPVPGNVLRARNYYQPGGWGSPLTGDEAFKGELVNVDISDTGALHVNVDKNAKVQAEIVALIAALPR